jgi:deoxyadenosine/deoxycytidine kinase
MRRPYIVSIEGNIGSGKTTLIHELEKKLANMTSGKKYIFLREPLDIWNSIKDSKSGENILQKYYKEPTQYALSFQIMAYMTFHQRLVDAIKDADEDTVIICERSMESSRNIFAKMLHEQGVIDDVNYQILEMFYEKMELIPVDVIVYLDTDVRTSSERIKQRNRKGEENISPEYLEKCNDYYEKWLLSMTSNLNVKPVPMLMLENTDNWDAINRIESFIQCYCYKFVGFCQGCNFEKKIYSDENHYLMSNYYTSNEKLLCKKCFDDCWGQGSSEAMNPTTNFVGDLRSPTEFGDAINDGWLSSENV